MTDRMDEYVRRARAAFLEVLPRDSPYRQRVEDSARFQDIEHALDTLGNLAFD